MAELLTAPPSQKDPQLMDQVFHSPKTSGQSEEKPNHQLHYEQKQRSVIDRDEVFFDRFKSDKGNKIRWSLFFVSKSGNWLGYRCLEDSVITTSKIFG